MSIGGVFMINPFSSGDFTACAASAAWAFSKTTAAQNPGNFTSEMSHTHTVLEIHRLSRDCALHESPYDVIKILHGRVRTKGTIHTFAMICANPIYRITGSWGKRNLSIMGKVCFVKTFLISQFVYIMQAFIIPDDVLREVKRPAVRQQL